MAGTIGIKIANGDFYPVIEENSLEKKRLVLTTVHDKQNSVQIDLYRSISKSMLDAQYIGSLVVEDIRSAQKGEPSIEMIISSDMDGNISADACDLEGGEHQLLDVSLKTLDTAVKEDDFPDFSIEQSSPSVSYNKTADSDEEDRKFPWLIMGLATIFVIIAVAILWFFFLGGRDVVPIKFFKSQARPAYEEPLAPPPAVIQQPPIAPAPPPPPAAEPKPVKPPAPEVIVQEIPPPVPPVQEVPAVQEPTVQVPAVQAPPPPVIKAPSTPPPARPQAVKRTRPPAPVSSYKVPAVIPKNGVVYQIRWGDTLWEIAEAFYRNPWLYPKIARDNKIANPDHIIAGSNVRIFPLQ